MRLIEYESYIKELVTKDVNNPEIYNSLQEMIMAFLKRKKVCRCKKDYEDLSYLIAGDIYLSMVKENLRINYYLGYLEKVYRKYAHDYYKENSSECLVFDDKLDAESVGQTYNFRDEFSHIRNKVYLEDCDKIIEEVMSKSCKYDRNSYVYNNLKMSLILSLLRGNLINFHLDNEQFSYLNLILKNFQNTVKKETIG